MDKIELFFDYVMKLKHTKRTDLSIFFESADNFKALKSGFSKKFYKYLKDTRYKDNKK